jgi:competence ComEA-like helix-hairpin-helix protein
MRDRPRRLPGTWLIIALVAAAVGTAAWLRATRVTAGSAGAATWPDMRIDVNAATAAELEVLPGLGPQLAERIAADRAALGAFADLDDLARVPGIGPKLVEGIRPYAVAGPRSAPRGCAGTRRRRSARRGRGRP